MSDIRNPYMSFSRYAADLCLFLLVAKQGQISGAAEAAGLSQPRISQRMRALEDSLGRALFLRERRGVTLTADGQDLRNALLVPMTETIEAFDRFRNTPRQNEFVILSDIAFASLRLLPELPSLNSAFPGSSISLLTMQMPDARNAPSADAVIRMEALHEPGEFETLLFRERVSTACSPEFAATHTGMSTPGDLLGKTLIDLSARENAPWYTWSQWLHEHGCVREAAREFIAFNSYDHVIHAARSGMGIALCWEGLIDIDAPASGLVRAIPATLESDLGYYLKIIPGRVTDDSVRVFDWLSDRFSQCKR